MGLNFPQFARNRFEEILNKTNYSAAGNTSLTRVDITRTKDSGGRITDSNEVETPLSGFIGYVTQKDRGLVEQGWVTYGDATLFVKHDETINIEDEIIDQQSVRWEITKLLEAPIVQGLVLHQRFALKRRD